jgi:hypothetical protein
MIKFLILLALSFNALASSVVINNKHDITIDGVSYSSGTGDCLTISNSSGITVINARFVNCYGVGVAIENSSNIRVKSSYFENVNGGVYAENSQSIKVNLNRLKNISRAWKMDDARGQFVQFNRVTGTGNIIRGNVGINEPGSSDPEDAVNLSVSSGVLVENNCFKGGGPSESGGGILAGDSGGSNHIIQNNTLVDVGQYGIGVASGTNIKLLDNWVYGRRQSFTNVGMYVWSQTPTPCSGITVQGNHVYFKGSDGLQNPFWDAENCGVVAKSGNYFGQPITGLDCTL